MMSFKSLQNHLDHSFSRAMDEKDGIAEDAMGGGTLEDMEAFNDALQKISVSNTVMNESLRAKHGITKAIIDGIQ